VCRVPVVGYDFLPTFFDLAGGGTKRLPDEIDGGTIRPLFTAPREGTVTRRTNALIFHRPRRLSSAVRQGRHKLMVYWKPDGSLLRHEYYLVDPDPREDGHDLAEQNPGNAAELQQLLLTYLKTVEAETPRRRGPKTRRRKK
jgi:hypothetical protein